MQKNSQGMSRKHITSCLEYAIFSNMGCGMISYSLTHQLTLGCAVQRVPCSWEKSENDCVRRTGHSFLLVNIKYLNFLLINHNN